MTLPAAKTRITPEEYLKQESGAQAKHEYHAGEVLAMSGGTYWHSRIVANLIGEARQRLKGSPCFVLESNMRVRLAQDDRYVYPDASILCEQPRFDPRDTNLTTIINPKVILEVLSDSTEAYDRGTKFSAYRNLESLDEYVLVSQNKPLIETFVRQSESTWLFAAWHGLEAVATLRAAHIELPLSEVYSGVTWDEASA